MCLIVCVCVMMCVKYYFVWVCGCCFLFVCFVVLIFFVFVVCVCFIVVLLDDYYKLFGVDCNVDECMLKKNYCI